MLEQIEFKYSNWTQTEMKTLISMPIGSRRIAYPTYLAVSALLLTAQVSVADSQGDGESIFSAAVCNVPH